MNVNTEIQIDVGDEVHHGPTGEDWIVAAVDGPDLYWCGYPYGGSGKVADCTLTTQATTEQRKKLLAELEAARGNERPSTLARIRIAQESKPELALEAPTEVDVALEYADGTRGPDFGEGDEREGKEFGEALKILGAEVKRLRRLTGYGLRMDAAPALDARETGGFRFGWFPPMRRFYKGRICWSLPIAFRWPIQPSTRTS